LRQDAKKKWEMGIPLRLYLENCPCLWSRRG
jgi:hypothetical protein